jgi:Beta-lactamase class A
MRANGSGGLFHRGGERFPLCSTFKVLAVAAVLRDHAALLDHRIRFTRADIRPWSPVTEKFLHSGLTVAELCKAALQHSDNTAGNLILAQLGGPAALTAFARSLGDTAFRLDRWEVELNAATPGDNRDTTTPAAMCATLNGLVCDDLLPANAALQLRTWMLGCATGATRFPAGAPQGWRVAHKTGGGNNGTANDVGVLLPLGAGTPLVVAAYLTGSVLPAVENDAILAAVARGVCAAEGLAPPREGMY